MDLVRLRKLEDFGNRLIFAHYEIDVESLLPTATMFGLVNSATILWGTFEDEDGINYAVVREMPGYLSAGCWALSSASGDAMRMMPQCAEQWNGGLVITPTEHSVEWKSTDSNRGVEPAFRLLYDTHRLEYRERDFMDLKAHRTGTGYQFYEPTHGQGATNHVFEASGTIAGKQVKGWLGFNVHFQKPGLNYRISPMVRGGQMLMWFDVANVYEDGSWEQGPIIAGRDGYCIAWITNDKGEITYSYDVEAEFDLDDDLYATEMRFSYFDARTGEKMQWVWHPKPGCNMVELPALAPHLKYKRSAEGSCVRVGETRKLVHTSAFPDFQVDDRIAAYAEERRQNVPPGFV